MTCRARAGVPVVYLPAASAVAAIAAPSIRLFGTPGASRSDGSFIGLLGLTSVRSILINSIDFASGTLQREVQLPKGYCATMHTVESYWLKGSDFRCDGFAVVIRGCNPIRQRHEVV